MRGGCSSLPFFLFLLLFYLFSSRDDGAVERIYVGDGANPRRPPIEMMPGTPEYLIEQPVSPQDSQGTAFAIGSEGVWLTAQHVVQGCDLVGLATGPRTADAADRVVESTTSDAALIEGALRSPITLPLGADVPVPGSIGYHMGFPSGRPALVVSELIGEANVVRGPSRREATLAWAEIERLPDFGYALGGISGGPTLDRSGWVIGINSAGSERRGRVLTTHPEAIAGLIRQQAGGAAAPIRGPGDAARRFQYLLDEGAIRQVYCDVV
jgi:S1-C subfamily serine protease